MSLTFTEYLLEFREEGEEWDHIHLPGERISFYLTGLKGSTRYELRLAAYNVFGRGEFSPTIDFTTSLAGKVRLCNKQALFHTESFIAQLSQPNADVNAINSRITRELAYIYQNPVTDTW